MSAQSVMRCQLWDELREERSGWKDRLRSKNPPKNPRNKPEDWSAITGNMKEMGEIACKRVIRVFISSTFTDTVFERNYVLEDVIPYLKDAGRERGFDIIFSEMRFGIRDDASEDNKTSELCMEELENCEKQSAGVFYVLISTDKYGFRPLPRRIPQNEMEELRSKMDDEKKALVDKFYSLDTNALDKDGDQAPEFVMLTQPEIGKRIKMTDHTCEGDKPTVMKVSWTDVFWRNLSKAVDAFRAAAIKVWSPDTVEAELKHPERWAVFAPHSVSASTLTLFALSLKCTLSSCLVLFTLGALDHPSACARCRHLTLTWMCRSQHPCKRYFVSVTEEEISRALFWLHQEKVKDRVHVFERTFAEIEHLDLKTDKLKDFIDIDNEKIAQDSVHQLRDLRRRLGEASHLNEHTTRYPPLKWKEGGIDPSCPQHVGYLRKFLDDFCELLLSSLDKVEAKLAVEAEPLADECRFHLWFAKVRADKYAATPSSEAALRQVRDYLAGPGGKPLVVYGPSGSGKTYVMAKAVAEEAERVSTPSPTGSRERGRI